MATLSLVEQAKDGDAAAIAALLTQSLKSKGIEVRGDRQSYCLHLWFTGNPAPPQAATVAYAQRAIAKLQVPTIGILQLYGEQAGAPQPQWTEEIALLSSALTAREDQGLAEPEGPEDQQPESAEALAPREPAPAAIARAYQELGLAVGASLPQVESVYFRRRAELLKRGDRAALEPHKWAFTTIKTQLEQAQLEQNEPAYVPVTEEAAPVMYPRSPAPRSQRLQSNPQPTQPAADDTDLLSFQNRYSNGLIFPLLLLAGMLMNAMPIVNVLFRGIKIWIHEFGHATIAWLAGRRAIPLPIGWTSVDPRRSFFVYVGILILLGLLFWAGRREGKRWPMVLAVLLAVVQFYMTWLMSANQFDMWLLFGGIGGEIYLSALLIVSFYLPLPEYFRWDFYRFPVVLAAAFCFWDQVWLWQRVPSGKASIPFGSMWGDVDDGDMNRLINDHSWTPGDIIGTYSTLTHLCLLGIFAVYSYTLFRQHREFFTALGRQWLP
ncbi:M50 family metallopeptidase [Nodosilinea nodulosa]|uniref:M50 family metallopeptidase n=1 Tax=Nodosilinea nodulosa TaxID=416001 RepID=UPI0002F6A8B9|nr:M50 family metallopeptidase [Nodosilinea nodulosa]